MKKIEVGLPVTVICGANIQPLDNVTGMTVGQVGQKMTEILSITPDHGVLLVDGQAVKEDYILLGGEEVEFKKPAGQKGQQIN